MARSETSPTEVLGHAGEPCLDCGAPLASDQRYCLECGRRRAAARVPYAELLAGRSPEDVLAAPEGTRAPAPPRRRGAALLAAAGPAGAAALLGLGILIGVLVADDGEERLPQQVAAPAPQKPPIINVNAGGGTGESAEEELTSDWPEGENGFTVQVRALPKDSSDIGAVDEAKSEAQSKGATDVGALDSDLYASLEPSQYVVYSGVFTGKDGKKKAQAALGKLKRDFREAKVIEVKSEEEALGVKGERPEEKEKTVDDQALKDLENSTGEEQQKKSAKLPETLKLPGKPPPPDKKKGGGGTEEQVIE